MGASCLHRRFTKNSLGILLLVVSFTGCGTLNITPCKGDFGTETPSGHVTPEVWAQFLSEIVTPRFPEGLSVWQASGQWRSASGEEIRESSYVLSLIHSDDAAPSKAVQEIIASYKTRFQQEAVLRVTSYACMSL